MTVQSSNFVKITTKCLSKHYTEMNGYHCFNFTEKTFLRRVDPIGNQKMSNFHFDLSLKLSEGEVHDFSGRGGAKILRGGAKRSQGRCAPPHTSPQNPAMLKIMVI